MAARGEAPRQAGIAAAGYLVQRPRCSPGASRPGPLALTSQILRGALAQTRPR